MPVCRDWHHCLPLFATGGPPRYSAPALTDAAPVLSGTVWRGVSGLWATSHHKGGQSTRALVQARQAGWHLRTPVQFWRPRREVVVQTGRDASNTHQHLQLTAQPYQRPQSVRGPVRGARQIPGPAQPATRTAPLLYSECSMPCLLAAQKVLPSVHKLASLLSTEACCTSQPATAVAL